ncbi:hypothetical protein SUGI_0418580 [Cryptomeria japonica]|uniref:zinc finger protein 10-like n=1 Tax=Cryptomeria japonica TaxID=3369 RepID=UPI002408B5FC|nr:zinc finger protein 10-like [Cryptomeria japonica]GLJ22259.1 hypothetical protein SUGI_0418580 [Cryptomeria japonica]
MAANFMIPLRPEEKEIQRAVGLTGPWSMWRPRVEEDEDSWEARAFAEDTAGLMGGSTWPPRSYSCNFCRREFRSAQALGGHMNVHRRDRAKLRQSPPRSLNAPDNHHLQSATFPSPVMVPVQDFCFLYPMPGPNSSSDQNPLVYSLNPNSSMITSSQHLPRSPLIPVPSRSFMASEDPNSNSNMVEFFPTLGHPILSSPSSSPPSTLLSISPYSPPPSDHTPPMNNLSNSSDSTGISRPRRGPSTSKAELGAGKQKQIGAFHPYLPRTDHKSGSSDERIRSTCKNDDRHARKFSPDSDNSSQDIDLELRLGQSV